MTARSSVRLFERLPKLLSGGVVRRIVIVLLLSCPSAWFVWRHADSPTFGIMQDDALYFEGAQSLAQQGSYKILSLPGEPWQTKYPPLYSLLLVPAWRGQHKYPENLRAAHLLTAWIFPFFLLALWAGLEDVGLTNLQIVAMLSFVAWNATILLLLCHLMADVLFAGISIASLSMAYRARDSLVRGLAIGAVVACAILAKTLGVVLVPAILAHLLLRKQWRCATGFVWLPLAAALGWALWSGAHRVPALNLHEIYYTDYAGYYLQTVPLHLIPRVFFINLSSFLSGIGGLFLYNDTSLPVVIVVTKAAGAVFVFIWLRSMVSRKPTAYDVWAVMASGVLLFWNFPPNERLLLPLAYVPLGACIILRAEWKRLADASQAAPKWRRGAAVIAAMLVVAYIGSGLVGLERFLSYHSEQLSEYHASRDWFARNTTPADTVMAFRDGVVYFATGRKSIRPRLPWTAYTPAPFPPVQFSRLARETRSRLVVVNQEDFASDGPPTDYRALADADTGLEQVFRSAKLAIYRLRPYAGVEPPHP